jgi:hypothetical protein
MTKFANVDATSQMGTLFHPIQREKMKRLATLDEPPDSKP